MIEKRVRKILFTYSGDDVDIVVPFGKKVEVKKTGFTCSTKDEEIDIPFKEVRNCK